MDIHFLSRLLIEHLILCLLLDIKLSDDGQMVGVAQSCVVRRSGSASLPAVKVFLLKKVGRGVALKASFDVAACCVVGQRGGDDEVVKRLFFPAEDVRPAF